jgi:transcriptional regulator with XRE-family HTH domain
VDQEQAKRFGRWLREQRQAAGLTTTELARRAGTTDGTIVRFEQGAFTAPSPNKLSRIAAALDLSVADIFSMAGYAVADELPSFQPYLRRRYGDMPTEAIDDLDAAFSRIIKKHGYDPRGPRPGEDEAPDAETLFN